MNLRIRANGFSLVEVLFAVFILAVGILGIIGLQLMAKQNNYDAIQRTTAAALASDIAERIRMNNTAVGFYLSKLEPVGNITQIPTTCNDPAGHCTNISIAEHDLATWHSLISGASDQTSAGENTGGLTEPSACITQDPLAKGGTVGTREIRIAIAWRGRSPLSNPAIDPCGTDPAGVRYGANNEYRRVFVLDAKIQE